MELEALWRGRGALQEQPDVTDFLLISSVYGTIRRGLGWGVAVAGSRVRVIEYCMYKLSSAGKKEKKKKP